MKRALGQPPAGRRPSIVQIDKSAGRASASYRRGTTTDARRDPRAPPAARAARRETRIRTHCTALQKDDKPHAHRTGVAGAEVRAAPRRMSEGASARLPMLGSSLTLSRSRLACARATRTASPQASASRLVQGARPLCVRAAAAPVAAAAAAPAEETFTYQAEVRVWPYSPAWRKESCWSCAAHARCRPAGEPAAGSHRQQPVQQQRGAPHHSRSLRCV